MALLKGMAQPLYMTHQRIFLQLNYLNCVYRNRIVFFKYPVVINFLFEVSQDKSRVCFVKTSHLNFIYVYFVLKVSRLV